MSSYGDLLDGVCYFRIRARTVTFTRLRGIFVGKYDLLIAARERANQTFMIDR